MTKTIRQRIKRSYGPVVIIMASKEAEDLILSHYQKDTWYELLKDYCYIKDKVPIKDLQGRITMQSEFPIRWITWNDMSQYAYSNVQQQLEPILLSVLEHHPDSPPSIDTFVQYGTDLFSNIALRLMYNPDEKIELQFYEGELLDHPVSIIFFMTLQDYISQESFLDVIKKQITKFTEEYSWTKEGWMESNILVYYTLAYHPDRQHDQLLEKCFSVLRNAHGLNTCLFQLDIKQDIKRLDHFIFDFSKNHLVPYMERTILHLNTQLSAYRKSTASRLFSAGKKYFSTGGFRSGTASPTEATTISEPSPKSHFRFHRDTPEFQMRRLADYAFILRDYKLCHTALDSLKKDFQLPKNSLVLISAMEWMHIVSFMNDSLPLDDKQYFDLYSTSYHRSKIYILSFRSLYIHVESLLERQLYTDAFSSLQKLTGNDTPDILNALLLERMAVIFLSITSYQLMKRKAMFYYTLSSHHYEKTNHSSLLYHACRTEEYALFLLPNNAWTTLRDHLHYTIGKLSRDQQQWSKALYNIQKLVKDTRNFYRPFQSSYIREFLHLNMTSTEWFTDIDIPSIDLNSISIENHPEIWLESQFNSKTMNENDGNIQHAVSRKDVILINITMTNYSVVRYFIYDLSPMIQQEDGTFIQGSILTETEFSNPHTKQHITLSFNVDTLPEICSSFRILGLSYHLGQQHIPIYRELHKCRDVLYKIVMNEQTLDIAWKMTDGPSRYDGSGPLLSLDSNELYQGQLFYRQLTMNSSDNRPEVDFQFKLLYKDDIVLDIPFHVNIISSDKPIDWSSSIASFPLDTSEWKSICDPFTILLYVTDCVNPTILYPPIILAVRYTVKSAYRYTKWLLYDEPISIVPVLSVTNSLPFYDVEYHDCTWNAKFLVDCQSIRDNIHVTEIQTIGLRHVMDNHNAHDMLHHINSGDNGTVPEHCRFMLTLKLENRTESLSHLNQILDKLKACFFIQESRHIHASINPIYSKPNILPESMILSFQTKRRKEYIRSVFKNETSESKLVNMLEKVIPVFDHQSFILILSWELLNSNTKGVNMVHISLTEPWYAYFTQDWLNSNLDRFKPSDTMLFTQGIYDRKRVIETLTRNHTSALHSRLVGFINSECIIHAILSIYNESACKSIHCKILLDLHETNDSELFESSLYFQWLGQQIHNVIIEPLESIKIKLDGLLLPNPVYSDNEKRMIQLYVWIIDDQNNKRKESCMIMIE